MTANSERKELKKGEQAVPTATHQIKPGETTKAETVETQKKKGG